MSAVAPSGVTMAAPGIVGPDLAAQAEVVSPSGIDALEVAQSVNDFYCNYDENHPGQGGVDGWLRTAPEGANTDCIDVVDVATVGCGFLQVPIDNYVTGETTTPPMRYWMEFDEVDGPGGPTVLPAEGYSWPEDYNGGSVTVQVYIGGPEQDYVAYANEAEWAYPGQTITIDTDCEDPVPVNYCDYTQIDTPYSVATWLATGAEAGANTDCIDVAEPIYEVCGQVTIPLTETVEPFNYWIEYVEGTDLSGEAFVAEGGVIAFPEDYNGGSVTVTAYIGGPEQDYVQFANEGDWAYPGQTITIDTDCEDPVPVNYCDLGNRPAGTSIASWLESAPEGALTDCLNVGEPVLACGALSIPFEDLTANTGTGYALYWVEGTDLTATANAMPITAGTFAEDYNDGTVTVTVYIGGPESDYVQFAGTDAQPYAYYNGGETFTIDTDCEEPVPVNYCDFSQIDTPYSVADWLAGAPDDADTDCIDVSEPALVCGSLDLTLTEDVEPFDYELVWVEGDTIPADESLWNTTWPITFAEDYNDGSVVVTVFIGGPEQDYVEFSGDDVAYLYANGGAQFTIDTDCEEPVPSETPEPTVTPDDDDDTTPVPSETPEPGTTPDADETPATTPDVDDDSDTDTGDADKADDDAEESPAVTTLPSTGAGNGPDAGMWTGLATIFSVILLMTAFGVRMVTGRR